MCLLGEELEVEEYDMHTAAACLHISYDSMSKMQRGCAYNKYLGVLIWRS